MEIRTEMPAWDTEQPIFASEEYLKTVSNEYGWIVGYKDAVKCFILPYVIKTKSIFRCLQFQTNTIYCSNLLSEDDEQAFLDETVEFLKQQKIDVVIPSPAFALFSKVPQQASFCKFGTYRINLAASIEELWAGIHSKHRNVIRKAEKSNVLIQHGKDYLPIAYDLIKTTQERSGNGFYPYSYIEKLLDGLGGHADVFVASYEGKPQGGAIILHSLNCAYYLYGGSCETPFTGALNLLQWEMIQYYRENGVQCYDLVGARIAPLPGSKIEGIQRFKSRFQSKMDQGFLWKIVFSPWKYRLLKMLMCIKNKSRYPDIVEEETVRHKVSETGVI